MKPYGTGEEAGPRPAGRKWLALSLLCLAQFMILLDLSIVNVALPSIQQDLGFSSGDLQWVVSGYALTSGGFLLLGGRAADLLGRRRVFVAGLVVFAASSLAGGLAAAPWMLITCRFLQGLAAAFLAPATLALITSIFAEGEERDRAVSAYAAMGATGFAAGMILGGLITEYLGWRWVMFINVLMALAVILPTWAVIPESRDEGASRVLDLPGATTGTFGLVVLIYAFSKAQHNGWASLITLGLVALGAVLLAIFVLIEHLSRAPLVPLNIFRLRPVSASNASLTLKSTVGAAWLFVLTLYFQEVLGYSALRAGLSFIPMGLGAIVAALLAGRVVSRLGRKPSALAGLVLLIGGLLLLTGMSAGGPSAIVYLGMAVGGFGYLFSDVPMYLSTTDSLREDLQGLAAGLLNTSALLGSACGIGVIAAVAATVTAASGGEKAGPEAMVDGFRWGLLTGVGFVTLALFITVLFLSKGTEEVESPSMMREKDRRY